MSPTFFLVGAPKAGTTSLFRYLGNHPEVGTSAIKEPCFFAPEVPVDPATDATRRDWETYLSLFAHTEGRRAIGEGSVAYLGSLTAASAIKTRVPTAQILMMLRDPADRLFAHYSAARASGVTTTDYRTWIDDERRREEQRQPIYGAIWAGRYATHVARFCEHFPSSQMHISYYDDFTSDPDATLARIFTFFGVDPSVSIDRRERHNVTSTARWPALAPFGPALRRVLPRDTFTRLRRWSRTRSALAPSPTDRALGIALYQQEIESLSLLTGRDLTSWLQR